MLIKSDSLKEISIALSKFQAAQSPVKPNSTNPFLKNRYADLTALIEATKDNLHANGLSVTQLLTNDGLTTMLLHSSGEYIGSTFRIEPTEGKGTNRAQEMGIAITYSRRYAYGAILGLVTDEDTDGSGKQTGQKQPGQKQSADVLPPAPPKSSPQYAEKARVDWLNKAKKTIKEQLSVDLMPEFERGWMIANKNPQAKRALLKWFVWYICAGKQEEYSTKFQEWSTGRNHPGFSAVDIDAAPDNDIEFAYERGKKAFKEWVAGLNGEPVGTPEPEEAQQDVPF